MRPPSAVRHASSTWVVRPLEMCRRTSGLCRIRKHGLLWQLLAVHALRQTDNSWPAADRTRQDRVAQHTWEPASVLVTSARLRPVSLSTPALPAAAKHMAYSSVQSVSAGWETTAQRSNPQHTPPAGCSCRSRLAQRYLPGGVLVR